MEYEPHGGYCCGISHVYNFGGPNADNVLRLTNTIQSAIETVEEGARENYEEYDDETDEYVEKNVPWRVFGHLIEIALTDQQMMSGWAPILKEKGFKLHRRWKNDNSGNYCNLLTYCPKETSTKRPYAW